MINIFRSINKKIKWHLINITFEGTKGYKIKRRLLNSLGHSIGKETKIVTPIYCSGKLIVGDNSWIGRNFSLNGNGQCIVGSNVDIGPDVSVLTGSHEIGTCERRAGKGYNDVVKIGSGSWICGRCTILGGVEIGEGCVVAACSLVNNDVCNSTLVAGVPAKLKREL